MEFTKASWPVGLHMSASSKEELTHHFPPLDPNVPWTSPIATIFNTMIPKLNTLSILFGLSKTEEDSEGMTSTKPVPVLLEDCINKPGFKEHLTHLESFVHYIDHVRSYMLVHPSEYKQLKTDKVEFISQSNEEEFKTFIQDLYSFFEITNADKLYKSPSSDSSKLDTVIRNLLNVDMSKIDKSILPIKIQENFKNLSLTSNKSTFDCYCAFEVMQPSTLEEYTSIRSKKEARPDIFSLDYLKTKNIMEDSQLWELAKIVLSPPPKAPAQKRTREGDQPEDESKPKKAATAKTKVKQPSKTKRESDDETKEPETKRPREEELPPTEPMEKDDEELLPAVDFDDARIGSSLAYNVSKVAVSRQRDHLHFYRMYYVLTSVYYYCTDMLNMFILAQEIHYNAFLKKKLVEFSHVRLYYYAHTLGFLLRNANVAETKSADQKMIPSRSMFAVLLTGESEESMPANYFNYLIPQDQRILKTESFVTPNIISHGLYDHIWKNLTMDARHYKPLFIPWMVGAFFNRVEDRQAELMTTELTKVTYPLVIRSNFPIYRFHLSYIYKQWIKVLGLSDLNQAKETMTTSDYNEAQLILLRSLPLLNKGVLLEKVYNTSGKMDYLYKILASANASKKSSKKMPSVPKEEDEEDNPEEFINASVLDSIDSTLWLNDKFLDFVTEGGQVSKLEMGTAKIVAPRFILLDGHVFRQPRTQLEWMQLAQGDSLRTLMFMNLKDTSLVLYLKKISGVNLEQVNKLFQNKSVFVIQHSDLDNIPRTFNNDEDLFTNISRIIIDRPLPPNGHEAHIYISDKKVKNETELITIQLNNLTRASRDPLTFEPMQKIHFHATISERRTLIFDFSKALFGIETMPIDQVEKAMADFMTASFSATVEGNKKKLILKPLFKPFELENCIPCKMPTSFDVDDISDPINGISRWWWNAHLWNEAYSLTLTHDEEQLIITDMDDLREVNIKKNLLEPLPYLGPYLVDCPNVLAQFDDLKEDIMQGRSLLGYKKRDTFNFSLTWSEPNNFTKDDVERLNDYKFYRIGSHLMNWITDPTTMLIHTFRDPELVNKKTYLPSTITNGLAPIAFSYNADRTAMTQLEYLKGSHLEARTQVNPAKQTNDGVLFTLRNLEISNTQASKEPHHWMANLCKIKEPKIWSDLGMSVINKHHYGDLNNDINQPSDFAHVFFGFTGLALLFSKNHINMDKSLIDREKDKAYFTAEQRRDIQEAKAAGKETIEITRLVLKGSRTLFV